MKLSRAALVTGLATLALVLPTTTADAASVTRYDGVGDLLKVNGEVGPPAPQPLRKQGDITKAKVTFSGDLVKVTTSHRALVKAGPKLEHGVRIVTSKVDRLVILRAKPGDWTATHEYVTYVGLKPVQCKTLAHQIDYKAALITVWIPRGCLTVEGVKPGAVQVGVGTISYDGNGNSYPDDAWGPATDGNSPLVLSPKVFRTP